MGANEQVGVDRRGGRRFSAALAAALVAAATGATLTAAVVLAGPAAATDDGEDLSDLLVDEVDGYDLQPRGDPIMGNSGPVDWDDMGGLPGLGTDELPSDMPTYVNNFIADDYDMFVMLMGLDIDDLDPSVVVAGAALGMRQSGGGEGADIVLPDADRAEVEYKAHAISDLGGPAGITYSAAAMADDDIVVLVMVMSYDQDIAGEQRELDRFVTAQAAFEPPPDEPGSGGFGGDEDGDRAGGTGDETAAGQTPADPAASRQPAGEGGSNARQYGLLVALGLLLVGLGLLIRYLVMYHFRPAAAAQAQAAALAQSRAATTPTWWPLVGDGAGGPRPFTRTPMPRHPPTAPPLPPAGGPPLAPAASAAPSPPRPDPRPAPPGAPPPVPSGGFGAARRAAAPRHSLFTAPSSTPPDPDPATDAATDGPTGDGWRLPG